MLYQTSATVILSEAKDDENGDFPPNCVSPAQYFSATNFRRLSVAWSS